MNKILYGVAIIVVVGGGLFLWYGPKLQLSGPEASPTPSGSSAELTVTTAHNDTLGDYLTDGNGMTLYVFGDDKKLESSCYDACAKMWPPFPYDHNRLSNTTDPLLKNLNIVKRSDGTSQYAWGDKPLYYYEGDVRSGDTKGNGINMVWSVVIVD